jgi:hydrogenase expression/formation protein HypE
MEKNNKNQKLNENKILLSHGDGGIKTSELINNLILKYFDNKILNKLEDSAVISGIANEKLAYTTDSFIVKPIFFPGGDIGKLCICGTINDLAASGAVPAVLSMGLIIEEGLEVNILERILESAGKILRESNTNIVTGDTKVVEKNGMDKIFINTSGIGFIKDNVNISPAAIKPGDKIIINGSIAEHGLAVLSSRPEFSFKTNIISDCAPLNGLIEEILKISDKVHSLRDATRGGIATVLIELSEKSQTSFDVFEDKIPIKREVRSLCEFLGLDPLYIANEGKMLIFVDPADADKILSIMKNNKYGQNSCIIGEVTKKMEYGSVSYKTKIGTTRILDKFYSEQLPRIC